MQKFLSTPFPSMSSPQEQLDLFQSIWNSSTEYSLIIVDLKNNIIAWNEGAKRCYGYDSEEILGKNAFILYDPHDIQLGKAQAILNEAREKGKWVGEVTCRRKNGNPFTAYLSVTLRYDNKKQPSGFTMISRDATQSIQPFKSSEANLKTSQDNLKISRSDLKESEHDLKTSQSDLKETEHDLKKSEKVNYQLVEQIKTQNENLININKELFQQNNRSKEANRLKSEFLANMSHELRTPLNAIIGFSDLMHSGRVGTILPNHQEYLGDILSSARHLLQLINDVLDLSKVEAGKMLFHPKSFNVKHSITEISNILRTLIVNNRIHLETQVDPLLDTVNIDPSKFKQILYNFLSNAIKFTPENGTVIVRALLEGNDDFRLEVEDSGIGIRTEDLNKLFVEFQQLDSRITKKYPGTGLGLALCRRIAEAQGGKVGLTSVFGKGSCFYAILPKDYSNKQMKKLEIKKITPKITLSQDSNTQTILLIEDDPDDCYDLAKIMTDAGYTISIAKNGAEAIKLFQTNHYNAITLDLILPDMSGFDILHVLRSGKLNQNTPVIVTSVVAEKSASVGYELHDFLIKPVASEELLASLESAGIFHHKNNLILVIDEDPNSLKLLKQPLTESGYQVISKQDGKSGLFSVAKNPPNIIILDLLMPDLDGFEFLRELRKMPFGHKIPVIIWTSKDLSEEEKALLKASCEGLVQKGEGPDSLLNEIARYLPKLKSIQHRENKGDT